MISGAELTVEVNHCKLDKGQVALWWLGQAGFIVKLGASILYLDPYLSSSDERQVEPLLETAQIKNADFVLGSHDHIDHIDRQAWPIIARACAKAKFIVPEFLREPLAKELDIPSERFIGLNDQTSFESEQLKITGIAAAHELLDYDEESGLYPYLGYAIEANGCRLYHCGDSCIYEGLHSKLKAFSPNVIILPINGRDAKRLAANCIGNMTYQEAADFAGVLTPGLTIPAHYGMFEYNSEDPSLFTDYMKVKYPSLNVHCCQYGRLLVFDCSSGSLHPT